MGANLTAGGATFRVLGPSAVTVFVSGDFNGWKPQDPAAQLVKQGNEWRGFIIDNATFLTREYHVDGFRFDQVTIVDEHGGQQFRKDLTDMLHFLAPSHPLIAEYWADQGFAVRDTGFGGLGFDAVWSAGLRDNVRAALGQAAGGAQAQVILDSVRDALNQPPGFPALWKSVEAVGFPGPGRWLEVFNNDVYDHWVNPIVAGNGTGIDANGGPMHGLPNSASIVIPANGFVVFARDNG
jgi:1,4-alpha-glucan branching enzyme